MSTKPNGKQDIEKVTIFVVKEHDSKSIFMTVVPTKGISQSEWTAEFYMQCIKEIGYSTTPISIKRDHEPAIEAVNQQVIANRTAQTLIEHSPVGSSQSNGSIENAVAEAEGQIRTGRLALEQNYGVRIPINHPIIPWLVMYAGFALRCYLVGRDGKTAYQRIRGKRFDRELGEFGEKVLFKRNRHTIGPSLNKWNSMWGTGIFLGVKSDSSEFFIGTSEGILKIRTIKRVPPSQRWNASTLEWIRGTPWNLNSHPQVDLPAEQQLIPIVSDEAAPPLRAEGEDSSYHTDSRNFKIFKTDLQDPTIGYTVNCPGCVAARSNAPQKQHTVECRERIRKSLENTEHGKIIIEAADQRFFKLCQRNLEKQERDKNKQDEEMNDVNENDENRQVEPASASHIPRVEPESAVHVPGENESTEPADMQIGILAQLAIEYIKYGKHVSELFSPPRVCRAAFKVGLKPGMSFDMTETDPDDGEPWDFTIPEKRIKAK